MARSAFAHTVPETQTVPLRSLDAITGTPLKRRSGIAWRVSFLGEDAANNAPDMNVSAKSLNLATCTSPALRNRAHWYITLTTPFPSSGPNSQTPATPALCPLPPAPILFITFRLSFIAFLPCCQPRRLSGLPSLTAGWKVYADRYPRSRTYQPAQKTLSHALSALPHQYPWTDRYRMDRSTNRIISSGCCFDQPDAYRDDASRIDRRRCFHATACLSTTPSSQYGDLVLP